MKRIVLGAALAAMLASASAAEAAIVTLNLDFTAMTEGPITSHSGSFSFSYDDVTLVPTLNSINFAIGATTFTTANAGIQNNSFLGTDPDFLLGGTAGGLTSAGGADDFFLLFSLPVGPAVFLYTTATSSSSFAPATLTPHVAANPVPEPAGWALMILGFGGLGAALRRRPVKAPRQCACEPIAKG